MGDALRVGLGALMHRELRGAFVGWRAAADGAAAVVGALAAALGRWRLRQLVPAWEKLREHAAAAHAAARALRRWQQAAVVAACSALAEHAASQRLMARCAAAMATAAVSPP